MARADIADVMNSIMMLNPGFEAANQDWITSNASIQALAGECACW
jgi:hypothetical protein